MKKIKKQEVEVKEKKNGKKVVKGYTFDAECANLKKKERNLFKLGIASFLVAVTFCVAAIVGGNAYVDAENNIGDLALKTQQGQENFHRITDDYKSQYLSGKISLDEYKEKIEDIESMDLANGISTPQIEQQRKEHGAYRAMGIASTVGASAAAIAAVVGMQMSDRKQRELVSKAGIGYSHTINSKSNKELEKMIKEGTIFEEENQQEKNM